MKRTLLAEQYCSEERERGVRGRGGERGEREGMGRGGEEGDRGRDWTGWDDGTGRG